VQKEARSVSASRARVLQVLTPVVTAQGLDLEDVEVTQAGRRSVVRVLVDKDGGVTLDDVADVSRAVSDALDALDEAEPSLLSGAYVLEVGSPGVDRPLVLPRHWRRNVGRLVKATLRDGSTVTGRVRSAAATEDGAAVLDVDGTEREVSYAEVQRALVQVEFNRTADEPDDERDEPEEEDES
jgi:ribosome maturation factor RimP